MGYLKQKYTKAYFTNYDDQGKPKGFGVTGIEDFLSGEIRTQDKDILNKLDFRDRLVLDLGFGRGEAIKYAVEHGAKKVVGVDFSESAHVIAKQYLSVYGIKADLFCADIGQFLKKNKNKYSFDIVLLLDVVEHIPRQELKRIFRKLPEMLGDKAVVVINTPVFKVDNDGFKDGIDPRGFEDSDDYEETKGMHINRYTKASLLQFMRELGFQSVSGHYFVTGFPLPDFLQDTFIAKSLAALTNYPLRFPQVLKWENYEYAYSRKYETEPNLTFTKKIFRFLKWKTEKILIRAKIISSRKDNQKPKVTRVIDGPLAGHKLWLSLRSAPHWPQMALGVYDKFIYAWLGKHLPLAGKVAWDIGAHIGYHSLCFAALAGEKGKIVAFEPNHFNIKRINKNLNLNPDLKKRIRIVSAALSDKNGSTDFVFTDQVDDSRSSGSHLGNILAPEASSVYAGFKTTKVKTFTADSLVFGKKIPPPAVMKIDVEGAEELVLTGAEKVIRKFRPVLFIEVHGITHMFAVQQFLAKVKYLSQIIDDADGSVSRCFILARPV